MNSLDANRVYYLLGFLRDNGKEHGNYYNRVYYRAPGYLNSRLPGYVAVGYKEDSSHYLGNWVNLILEFQGVASICQNCCEELILLLQAFGDWSKFLIIRGPIFGFPL